jgi:hypothetical protein
MQRLEAHRIISAGRRGSSRPVLVETSAGIRLVKLRGAGQGREPLIAEIIVAELAGALRLNVPPRTLIDLSPGIPTADWDDELDDLLHFSTGLNLGFDYLEGARELRSGELEEVPHQTRTAAVWLDRLVMNHDRTVSNPHVLCWADQFWLIDHGAALPFQYRWSQVMEQSPREAWIAAEEHAFDRFVTPEDLGRADPDLASQLRREVLEAAVTSVPDDFLLTAAHSGFTSTPSDAHGLERRRSAYVAYLWKRLRAPRPFLNAAEVRPSLMRGKPRWLTGR